MLPGTNLISTKILAVPMTHFDVSFLDLNGNERSHYDGKAVGENLHACNSLSSTYTGNEPPPLNRTTYVLAFYT